VNSTRRDWLQRVASHSVRNPRTVLTVWLVISILAIAGVRLLVIDTGTSAFLDRSSPEWSVYQESLRKFGGDEIVVVAFRGEEPYEPEVVSKIVRFTSAFEGIPGVRRVDSIASVPVVLVREDGSLSLQPALSGYSASGNIDLEEVATLVRMDRIAPRNLVSEDETVFAINVVLDSDIDRGREEVVSEIRRLLEGRPAWISGVPVFRTEVNSRTRDELALFVPVTVLLVGIVVLAASRRPWAVLVSLGTSGVGVWCLLGAMGLLGVPLSLSTMILPSVLLALGSAYIMHVLSAAGNATDAVGLENGVLLVSRPVGLSGLTTSIGFLAMSTVRIEAIRQLGVFGAIGVIIVLAATLSLAPALLSLRLRRNAPGPVNEGLRRETQRFVMNIVHRNRRGVIVVWILFLSTSAVGLARLDVETDIVLWFSEGTEVRQSFDSIQTTLSGITPVNVMITAPAGRSILDADALTAIEGLARYLEALPSVGRSISIADPLIQLHSGFNPESAGVLPTDSSLVAQYLLLLDSIEQLSDVLAGDRTQANVLLRLKENGSRRIVDVGREVDEWWKSHGPSEYTVVTTGVMYEFGRAEEEIAYGQMRGLGLALAAVSGILVAIFRKPRIVIAALIPNLVPLAIAYGLMGLLGIALDAATICIGALALGVAVDDTIHVVSAFDARVQSGAGDHAALAGSVHQVAPALIYSTAAIAIGFSVLGFSEFVLIRNLGLVTSAMVVVCLVSDLSLLPALLVSSEAVSGKASRSGH
jgi:predicted RND superfamily exporter protein